MLKRLTGLTDAMGLEARVVRQSAQVVQWDWVTTDTAYDAKGGV